MNNGGSMPAAPPIETGSFERPPTFGEHGDGLSQDRAPRQDSSRAWPRWAGAGAAALLLVGGGLFVGNRMSDGGDEAGSDEVPTAVSGLAPGDIEVCPDGMYKEGQTVNPFYSSEHAQGHEQPEGGGFLHVSPTERLENNTELVDYLFGSAPGVACDNAPTIATLEALRRDILGSGSGANGFENTDIDALTRYYVRHPGQARTAAEGLAGNYGNSAQLNEEPVRGPMFMVVQIPTGNRTIPVEVAYAPVSADYGTGQLFELNWGAFINDSGMEGVDTDQKIYIDTETGQIIVIKSVGADVVQELAQDIGGGDRSDDRDTSANSNNGGGSGDGPGNGPGHNGDTNGCDGSCGTGSNGGGNNGGGGCGGCGGGGGSTTSTTLPGGGSTTTTTSTPPPPPTTTTTTPPPPTTTSTTTPPNPCPPPRIIIDGICKLPDPGPGNLKSESHYEVLDTLDNPGKEPFYRPNIADSREVAKLMVVNWMRENPISTNALKPATMNIWGIK